MADNHPIVDKALSLLQLEPSGRWKFSEEAASQLADDLLSRGG